MNMPYSQFTGENANLNYGLAALMAYYFYHMDGKGGRPAREELHEGHPVRQQ